MSRLSYARVLVEIDLRETLPEQIAVCLPNGIVIDQRVVYETLPKFCKFCKVLGHLVDSCSKSPKVRGCGVVQQKDATLVEESSLPAEKQTKCSINSKQGAGNMQSS